MFKFFHLLILGLLTSLPIKCMEDNSSVGELQRRTAQLALEATIDPTVVTHLVLENANDVQIFNNRTLYPNLASLELHNVKERAVTPAAFANWTTLVKLKLKGVKDTNILISTKGCFQNLRELILGAPGPIRWYNGEGAEIGSYAPLWFDSDLPRKIRKLPSSCPNLEVLKFIPDNSFRKVLITRMMDEVLKTNVGWMDCSYTVESLSAPELFVSKVFELRNKPENQFLPPTRDINYPNEINSPADREYLCYMGKYEGSGSDSELRAQVVRFGAIGDY